MSTTVAVGGFEVTSNTTDTAGMVESLKPQTPDSPEPRVLVDQGKPVKDEPESDLSKAASELGKEGGKAAAKARKAIKPIPDAPKETKADDTSSVPVEPSESESGDDADADAEAAGAAEAKDKRGNPRHDPQARVAQATREAKEARERAAALEARLERLERERTAPPADARPEPRAEAPQKPKPEEFESYEEYLDARDKHNREEWTREMTQRQQAHETASRHVQRIAGAVDGLKASIAKAVETTPDFHERVSPEIMGFMPSFTLDRNTQRPNATNGIADYLLSAPDRAPDLMLYLTEHPQDLQRIAALSSSHAVTRELAKLEARLDAVTAGVSSEPPKSSQANPPVRPVTGAPSVASGNGAPRPGESFDSWYARVGKDHPATKR